MRKKIILLLVIGGLYFSFVRSNCIATTVMVIGDGGKFNKSVVCEGGREIFFQGKTDKRYHVCYYYTAASGTRPENTAEYKWININSVGRGGSFKLDTQINMSNDLKELLLSEGKIDKDINIRWRVQTNERIEEENDITIYLEVVPEQLYTIIFDYNIVHEAYNKSDQIIYAYKDQKLLSCSGKDYFGEHFVGWNREGISGTDSILLGSTCFYMTVEDTEEPVVKFYGKWEKTQPMRLEKSEIDFGSIEEKDDLCHEQEVVVYNESKFEGKLLVPESTYFEIKGFEEEKTLLPYEQVCFMLQPKSNLEVGKYNEEIKIVSDTGVAISYVAKVEVTKENADEDITQKVEERKERPEQETEKTEESKEDNTVPKENEKEKQQEESKVKVDKKEEEEQQEESKVKVDKKEEEQKEESKAEVEKKKEEQSEKTKVQLEEQEEVKQSKEIEEDNADNIMPKGDEEKERPGQEKEKTEESKEGNTIPNENKEEKQQEVEQPKEIQQKIEDEQKQEQKETEENIVLEQNETHDEEESTQQKANENTKHEETKTEQSYINTDNKIIRWEAVKETVMGQDKVALVHIKGAGMIPKAFIDDHKETKFTFILESAGEEKLPIIDNISKDYFYLQVENAPDLKDTLCVSTNLPSEHTITLMSYLGKENANKYIVLYEQKAKQLQALKASQIDSEGYLTLSIPTGVDKHFIQVCGESCIKLKINDKHFNINGKVVENDVVSRIVYNVTMVPLRVVAEGLGANVMWNSEKKCVEITESTKSLTIDVQKTQTFNAKTAILNNGRVLVPLRYVSESMGAVVIWDGQTKSVEIVK